MSRPFERRTVTRTSWLTSASTKRSMAASLGRFIQLGRLASSLSGIAFTFACMPRISFASAAASCGESL